MWTRGLRQGIITIITTITIEVFRRSKQAADANASAACSHPFPAEKAPCFFLQGVYNELEYGPS